MVVCESVPNTVSGYATVRPPSIGLAHDAREVLDVDLVHDAGFRRDDAEVPERRLSPSQEHVAFAVPVVLEVRVQLQRVGAPEVIDLHRVVDHQFHGLQRIDLFRAAAERDHAVAHGRQIDDARHAGEVLEQHARRHERDLVLQVRRGRPGREGPDVLGVHERRVLAAQEILEQNLQREGQAADMADAGLLERRQAEVIDRIGSDGQRRASAKGIK